MVFSFVDGPLVPSNLAFDPAEIAVWTPGAMALENPTLNFIEPDFAETPPISPQTAATAPPNAPTPSAANPMKRIRLGSSTQQPRQRTPGRRPKFRRTVPMTVIGNNRSGRRGVLTCALCRFRKIKCVYAHVDAPCQFCRSKRILEPCPKLLGEKTRARNPARENIGQSRPLTRYDPSIPSKHLNIFEYMFALEDEREHWQIGVFRDFIRALISMYGLSVDHTALRYATLAYIVHTLNIKTVEEHDRTDIYYQMRASMMSKLDDVAKLDESDVYASYFIALTTAPSSPNPQISVSESDLQICFNNIFGCLAVAQAVYSRDYGPRRQGNIPAPWYFVRSSLITIYTIYGGESVMPIVAQFDQILGRETYGQLHSFYNCMGFGTIKQSILGAFSPYSEVNAALARTLAILEIHASGMRLSPATSNISLTPDPNFRSFLEQIRIDYSLLNIPTRIRIISELVEYTRTMRKSSPLYDSGRSLCLLSLLVHIGTPALIATLNRFLAVLLNASSLIDGLSSADAIQIGQEVVAWLNIVGGIFVLENTGIPNERHDTNGAHGGSPDFADLIAFAGRCYIQAYELTSDGPTLKRFVEEYVSEKGMDARTLLRSLNPFRVTPDLDVFAEFVATVVGPGPKD